MTPTTVEPTWLPPTSLVAYETTRHPLDLQSHPQRLIHAPYAARRLATINALHTSTDPALVRRAERLGFCCCSPTINARKGHAPTISPGRCRDRLCPHCQSTRANEIKHRLMAKVGAADGLRFITLTVRMNDDPLGSRINFILKAFTRLRHRSEWKKHVTGGCTAVEVTTGKDNVGWHAHLHVLAEGTFWAQKALQHEWSSAVGELAIADIRLIPQRQKALNYISGYVTKGMDCTGWTDDRIRQLAHGLHRRRMIFTFGRWAKTNPDPVTPTDEATPTASRSIHVNDVCDAIDTGRLSRETDVPLLCKAGRLWRLLFSSYLSFPIDGRTSLTDDDVSRLNTLLLGIDAPPPPDATPTHLHASTRQPSTLFPIHEAHHR